MGLRHAGRAERGLRRPVRGRAAGAAATRARAAAAAARGPRLRPSVVGAPAYPGRQFSEGDSSEDLKAWQKQMGTRGYDLVGTGYFGPKTKAAVLDLQAKAGLNVVGYIGPKTWAAAWASAPAAPAPRPAAPAADDRRTDLRAGDATSRAVWAGRRRRPWPGKTVRPG